MSRASSSRMTPFSRNQDGPLQRSISALGRRPTPLPLPASLPHLRPEQPLASRAKRFAWQPATARKAARELARGCPEPFLAAENAALGAASLALLNGHAPSFRQSKS